MKWVSVWTYVTFIIRIKHMEFVRTPNKTFHSVQRVLDESLIHFENVKKSFNKSSTF